MFSPRQSGSRGTLTSRCRARRAPSRRASPPARARARAPRSRTPCRTRRRRTTGAGASSDAELEVRRGRRSHSARSLGSSRSMPTMRPSPGRSAHSTVSTPSPQPTSRIERGAARAHSSSSVPWKPAISRLTTGFAEPYLSKVLPVGDLGGGAHSFSASRSSVLPVAPPAWAPVVGGCPVAARARLVVRGLDAEVQLHAPHALEDALLEHARAGQDVAHDAERGELHGDDEQRRAEDQRLDVAAAVAAEKNQRKRAQIHGPERVTRGHHEEQPQRLVERVDAEDRHAVAAHVGPHRREQARLARLRVGPDRDVVDGHQHLARLDDRLERVGELGDHLHLQRGLAVVGAEAGGGVGHVGVRRAPHDRAAPALEPLLERREVLDPVGLAVADDHVGVALEDRARPAWDVAPSYWLSASVLTITSAPSFRQASSPAWNAAARPLLLVSRTMWSTPPSRATSTVRSVEPSSITSHSTRRCPGPRAAGRRGCRAASAPRRSRGSG